MPALSAAGRYPLFISPLPRTPIRFRRGEGFCHIPGQTSSSVRGKTMKVLLVAATVFALAAPAANAAQLKRLVWVKATASWTAQARQHGAAAVCDKWTRANALGCEFKSADGRYGATLVADPRPCINGVQLTRFKDPTSSRQHLLATVDLGVCTKRWWLTLPSPWTVS